jgi:high affinity sulfate transporter 1
MWKSLFPPFEWLKSYRLKDVRFDAFSGITLAAYAIPVSMAYATLAGLPVHYGIYGYLIGGLFYAVFGTGMQLSIGPTSAISLLIGTALATVANGDVQQWVRIASLTALLMAGISLMAYILKLNSFINFISGSVLLGFKAGAALTIAMTQLPKLLGVPGRGSNFLERAVQLISQLPQVNFAVLVLGVMAILLLVAGQKIFPGRPIAILLVICSIVLVSIVPAGDSGILLTGDIPAGLPEFRIPAIHAKDIGDFLPLAFACFLLAYIESVSAAKTLAAQGGYEIDTRQELLALSAANAATALGQGFPVTGGLSQSAVNSKAGARSPLSIVFASLTIALCLLFLTGTLKNLPEVVLASILLVAVSGLIDLKGLRHLRRISTMEFTVAMIAFAGVIIFGILKGVVLAAIASIVLMLIAVSDPHIAFLGRIPGTRRYTDISRHPDNELIPGVLLFRVEASVLYFNVDNIRKNLWEEIKKSESPPECVIWDFSTSPYVDTAGAGLIKKLYLDLNARGITLKIAEAHSKVRDILRAEGIEHLIGHISRKVSIDDLVNGALEEDQNGG